MATVRLNKTLKNTSSENIPRLSQKQNDSVYVDLHLDFSLGKIFGEFNQATTSDIRVDLDYEAIRNSIRNIFNTKKGQKILSPEFGASLDQFLFERVDQFYGNLIGNEILRNLTEFEPRITVNKVSVLPIPDDNTYKIWLAYTVIKINKKNEISFSVSGGQVTI